MSRRSDIEVFYDGDCPVCRFEVRLYRRIDTAERIRWTDIDRLSEADLPPGKTREDLLGRFHVRNLGAENGEETPVEWFIGVDAFARIWRVLPGFRYFAFLFDVQGLKQLAMAAYRLFLNWQKWHRRRRTDQG